MMQSFRRFIGALPVRPPDKLLFWFGVTVLFVMGLHVFTNVRAYDFLIGYIVFATSASAFAFGVWRSFMFHPAARPKYLRWLKQTPWHWPKSLPLGPVWPTWMDIVIVAAFTVLCAWSIPPGYWFAPPLAYMLGCALVNSLVLIRTGRWILSYAMWAAFGWVAIIAPEGNLPFITFVMFTIYTVTLGVAIRSLRDFPWKEVQTKLEIEIGHYQLLSAEAANKEKGFFLSVPWAAIVGWWIYSIVRCIEVSSGGRIDPDGVVLIRIAYSILMLVCAGPYSRAYFENIRAPIGFFGRMANGLYFIRDFDRVKWIRNIALIVGLSVPFLLNRHGVPLAINLGLCAAGELAIFSLGPDPKKWFLTGGFRIKLNKPGLPGLQVQPAAPNPIRNPLQQQFYVFFGKFFPKFIHRAMLAGQTSGCQVRRVRKIEPSYLRVIPKCFGYILPSIWFMIILSRSPFFWLNELKVILPFALLLPSVYYGINRVINFHPGMNRQYLEWLKQVPWHPGRPLPFGPVELVWQDIVAVGLMGLTSFFIICVQYEMIPEQFQYPLPVFFGMCMGASALIVLVIYNFVALVGIFLNFGKAGTGLGMLVIVGIMLLNPGVIWCSIWLIVLTVITSRGLRKSLDDFPWTDSWIMLREKYPVRDIGKLTVIDPVRDDSKIPPLQSYLSPKIDLCMMTRRTRMLLSLTIGWLVFAIIRLMLMKGDENANPAMCFLFLVVFLFLVPGRVFVYYERTLSPMNFWGRLFTLRWIMWRYDREWLTSFGLFALAMAIPGLFYLLSVPVAVDMGIAAFAVLALFSFGGTALKKWLLTGGHRPGSQRNR